MIKVTVTEAQQHLSNLLSAAEAGESVEIWTMGGRSFRLEVIPDPANPPTASPEWLGYPYPGSCKGLIEVPDDFDEPLEDLKEYTE